MLDPGWTLIVVGVELSGESGTRVVVDMALDTGSTYMMIPWGVAEGLGHDPAASRDRIHLGTASSVEVVPLVTLKVVRALGVEATEVQAASHDLPPGSRVRGLLGLSFLKNFDIDLHFRRGILEARDI